MKVSNTDLLRTSVLTPSEVLKQHSTKFALWMSLLINLSENALKLKQLEREKWMLNEIEQQVRKLRTMQKWTTVKQRVKKEKLQRTREPG